MNLLPLQLSGFYPRYYLAAYSDLTRAYGPINDTAAEEHYRKHGYGEGRSPNPFFSPVYYLAQHPDLRAAFGEHNYTAAMQHWLRHGISEGRAGSVYFDIGYYLRSHPDLLQTFGDGNYDAAFDHWKRHGNSEKRATAPDGRRLEIVDRVDPGELRTMQSMSTAAAWIAAGAATVAAIAYIYFEVRSDARETIEFEQRQRDRYRDDPLRDVDPIDTGPRIDRPGQTDLPSRGNIA